VSEIALLFSAGFAVPSGAAEVAAEAAFVVPAISSGLAVPDAAEVVVAGFVEPEPETVLSFLELFQSRFQRSTIHAYPLLGRVIALKRSAT
jgi:hypothetical protein